MGMRRLAPFALVPLVSLFAAGCGDGRYDAKTPGEPLGSFAMVGKLERDECEAAVLGVVDPWKFDLRLSRLAHDLYWLNGREAISGALASDERSFRFDTAVDITLEPARRGRAACIVSRRDSATGSLSPSAENATRVEAEISFIYQVREKSECANIIGVPGGFASLPCRVDFSLSGDRVEDE
jgi:hypothetical protein